MAEVIASMLLDLGCPKCDSRTSELRLTFDEFPVQAIEIARRVGMDWPYQPPEVTGPEANGISMVMHAYADGDPGVEIAGKAVDGCMPNAEVECTGCGRTVRWPAVSMSVRAKED